MGKTVSLLFAGDFVPHSRTKPIVDSGNYENLFSSDVIKEIRSADYSVVNLEAPIITSRSTPISKIGPILHSGNNTPNALKYAGFRMALLANNHMNDYGSDGILNTISRCLEENIDVIGAGSNREEASQFLIKNISGVKIAFINCCEHEFSITDPHEPGCNPLDPIQQSYTIRDAKKEADFVIIMVHGGIEHYQLPTPNMQRMYRFFVDQGANAVINHHQHCFSGYEIYNGAPIIYGLGNFCFDLPKNKGKKWQEGYLIRLNISNSIEIEPIPYIQNDAQVGVRLMNFEQKQQFNVELDELNSIIAVPNKLEESYNLFLKKTYKDFRAILSLYPNRILTALCRRGLLPVYKNKYRFRRILLNISCESHLDRLKHYLRTNID